MKKIIFSFLSVHFNIIVLTFINYHFQKILPFMKCFQYCIFKFSRRGGRGGRGGCQKHMFQAIKILQIFSARLSSFLSSCFFVYFLSLSYACPHSSVLLLGKPWQDISCRGCVIIRLSSRSRKKFRVENLSHAMRRGIDSRNQVWN
jgi:hypothetical protein